MNDLLRKHVGFDSEDNSKKQIILDNETLKSIFSSKNQKEFEEKVKKSIVAFHEKDIIIKYAKQIRENDYNRISFLEGYTGKDFRNQ
jgi:nuclear transport factor 2 (NTF2) superfamily protein